MNKIRQNIILNRQNSKASTKSTSNPTIVKDVASLSSTNQAAISAAAKKKRSALGNISNATTNTKEEVSKKTRFGNPVFGISLGSKKDSTTTSTGGTKSLSSKENLLMAKTTTTKKVTTSVTTTTTTTTTSKQVVSEIENHRHLVLNCEKLELNDRCSDMSDDVFEEEAALRPCDVKGWVDIDAEDLKDEFNVADYVTFVFDYYRKREGTFQIGDYLTEQPHLNKQMRHLLIDWMVEVQQQLEFNHEVLYLSVKLLDLYLNCKRVEKEKLQLLGGAAMFIACKYEERIPPVIDDFIYVSDNAYDRNELIRMEIDILKTIKFDLGIPLSYTFLRRYAKCLHADMKFLTLARYILELALQEYAFAYVKDSLKACAALFLALKLTCCDEQKSPIASMKSTLSSTEWNETLIHYTDVFVKDFIDYVPLMNTLLKNAPVAKYKTIFKKYSHQVFYEVAKIEPLNDVQLESIMAANK